MQNSNLGCLQCTSFSSPHFSSGVGRIEANAASAGTSVAVVEWIYETPCFQAICVCEAPATGCDLGPAYDEKCGLGFGVLHTPCQTVRYLFPLVDCSILTALHQLSTKVMLFQQDSRDQRKRVVFNRAIARIGCGPAALRRFLLAVRIQSTPFRPRLWHTSPFRFRCGNRLPRASARTPPRTKTVGVIRG
jgi:hypothetical protein